MSDFVRKHPFAVFYALALAIVALQAYVAWNLRSAYRPLFLAKA